MPGNGLSDFSVGGLFISRASDHDYTFLLNLWRFYNGHASIKQRSLLKSSQGIGSSGTTVRKGVHHLLLDSNSETILDFVRTEFSGVL